MSGGLQSFLKSVDVKIGWGRVGFLLSLTIITISGIVLYRMLREINFEDVIDAVEAVEKHNVVKAAMFVAAGYFTLTFYDLFALRTIGRPDIPYRVAALAGFTSYAVGHNVGASAFTGGAVAARFGSVRRFNTHPQVRPIAELDQGEEPGLPGDGAGARKAVVLKSPVPRGWRGERRRCSALRLRWIAAIIFSKEISSPPRALLASLLRELDPLPREPARYCRQEPDRGLYYGVKAMAPKGSLGRHLLRLADGDIRR